MMPDYTESAWEMLRRLDEVHGRHNVTEMLYGWFSATEHTISFSGAGRNKLHCLPEAEAMEVMAQAEVLLREERGRQGKYGWQAWLEERHYPW